MDNIFADKIKHGAVGVMPTDTIYGLVCSALSKKAVERIYSLKQRSASAPLIVLISSLQDLKQFGIITTNKEDKNLRKLWPNSISIILPCPFAKFSYLHRGTKTIAFRFPKQKWIQTLLKATGPIVATSVNPSGQPHAKSITEAKEYFGNLVDFYIDDGKKPELASTLITLEDGEIFTVRQGAFTLPRSLKSHRIIKKKTWPDLFEAVRSGKKTFDMRTADFEAEEGDLLILQEFDPKKGEYTGRSLKKKISHIFKFNPKQYPFASQEDLEKFGLQIMSLE